MCLGYGKNHNVLWKVDNNQAQISITFSQAINIVSSLQGKRKTKRDNPWSQKSKSAPNLIIGIWIALTPR